LEGRKFPFFFPVFCFHYYDYDKRWKDDFSSISLSFRDRAVGVIAFYLHPLLTKENSQGKKERISASSLAQVGILSV
jgi:hypothetical protein